MANCFQPVILCHLPQHFHLDFSWRPAIAALGLAPGQRVAYAREYHRTGALNLPAARHQAARGKQLAPWLRHLPRGREVVARMLLEASRLWR